MRIPKSYTIFGNKVTVKEVDRCEDDNYGEWNDITETITLAHRIKSVGEIVSLTPTQIETTFWHKYFHSCQWYLGKPYDEVEAQSYANMMMELIRSSGLKINPNIIQEPLNPIEND